MLVDVPQREARSQSLDAASHSSWEGPMFLTGMPRSGTKLLRGLLTQHPRVRIPAAETDFLPFLDRWVTREGRPDSAPQFERMFQAMRNAAYFQFRGRNAAAFDWTAWRERCEGRYDVAGLFEGFVRYELHVDRGSGIVWGDKSPAYVRCVPLLLRHFPQARIIHLVRDVRDYCVSIRKAWNKDIRRAAYRWEQDVHQAHMDCASHPRRCLEVHYEHLLQHPDREMRRICVFLGLPYLGSLTDLSRPVENYGDAAGHARIMRHNFNKFEQRLSSDEIETIEALALPTMKELGYQPTRAHAARQMSAGMQQWLRLKDGMQLIMSDIPRHGLLRAVKLHAGHQRMVGGA